MITRLRPDYLKNFTIVARLICGEDAPWLEKELWRWNGELSRDRYVEEIRLTRAQMRSKLQDLESASSLLAHALESLDREFLDALPSGPIADPERLRRELEDLCYGAGQARDCSDLATKSGVTKAGPGKARPEAMSPRTLCAIIISEGSSTSTGYTQSEEPQSGAGRRDLLASRRRRSAQQRRGGAASLLALSLRKGPQFDGKGVPRRVQALPC